MRGKLALHQGGEARARSGSCPWSLQLKATEKSQYTEAARAYSGSEKITLAKMGSEWRQEGLLGDTDGQRLD